MYLFYDENNKVNLIYYQEPTEELLRQRYMKVELMPELEQKEGMENILMCDGKKVWYEHREIEPTEIDILSKKVERLSSENEAKDDLLQEIILQMYQ